MLSSELIAIHRRVEQVMAQQQPLGGPKADTPVTGADVPVADVPVADVSVADVTGADVAAIASVPLTSMDG